MKTGEWADIKKNETDVRTTEAEKEDARGNRLTKKALSKALLGNIKGEKICTLKLTHWMLICFYHYTHL